MGHIVAVANQKGGVGKTTTSLNVAAYLSHLGKRVLLVDFDPQANATSGLGVDHQALSGGVYEALVGLQPARELVISTTHPRLDLLPGTAALAGAAVELVTLEEREFVLKKALQEIAESYDFVIIDNPPSLGLITLNGLVAADSVLVPVQAEYFALEGLGQLMSTIDLVRKHLSPKIDILGAVITMFDARTRLSQEVLEELYRYFPSKMFRSVIPRSIRLAEAPSFGKTILGYDPESKAAKAYERLARELMLRHEERFTEPLHP